MLLVIKIRVPIWKPTCSLAETLALASLARQPVDISINKNKFQVARLARYHKFKHKKKEREGKVLTLCLCQYVYMAFSL